MISRDKGLLEAYQRREDVHINTASAVLGIPKEAVTQQHRQLAKALNFGLIYGMGAETLAEQALTGYGVTLSKEEALKHREAFFRGYPGLRRWHASVKAQRGSIDTRTLAGRRRLDVGKVTYKLNTPVQGSGADGLKIAMAKIYEDRQAFPGAYLVNTVHDELVFECAKEEAHTKLQFME